MNNLIYRSGGVLPLSDERAQVFGEYISSFELEHRDAENIPDLLIEDARSPDSQSPLKDYYEWNDAIAGEKYRKHQSQLLLTSIEVKVINQTTNQEEWTRAFHPVAIVRKDDLDAPEVEIRTWTTKIRILSEDDLKQQIIERAYQELLSWEKRWRQYQQDLEPIFLSLSALIPEGIRNGGK